MEETFALSIFSLFFLFTRITSQTCAPASCAPTEPTVRFPFHLSGRQPAVCGHPEPGFRLSCDSNNQTILNLPSGQVVVKFISYTQQTILIDPQFCNPNRINEFSIDGTSFLNTFFFNYTFFNCSSQYPGNPTAIRCLSHRNYYVLALPTDFFDRGMMPLTCRNISTITIPVRRYGDFSRELELQWFMPECSSCENDGGTCGTLPEDPNTVVCFRRPSRGFPANAKYGISIGIGLPALLCIIGAVYFTRKKVRDYSQNHYNQTMDISSIAITPRPGVPTLLMGLDGPTIESYPKIVLGDSGRLPKANNDGTCPICLSDYQPKEELRSIPECNHYFHVECIDAWLRMNATCPLCRTTQESLVITSC